MLSANTVAQNPGGNVIPPSPPGHTWVPLCARAPFGEPTANRTPMTENVLAATWRIWSYLMARTLVEIQSSYAFLGNRGSYWATRCSGDALLDVSRHRTRSMTWGRNKRLAWYCGISSGPAAHMATTKLASSFKPDYSTLITRRLRHPYLRLVGQDLGRGLMIPLVAIRHNHGCRLEVATPWRVIPPTRSGAGRGSGEGPRRLSGENTRVRHHLAKPRCCRSAMREDAAATPRLKHDRQSDARRKPEV